MSKRRRNNRPVECSVPESNYRRIDKSDWRAIQDDREKYNAYLCSREWAERREAVRVRAKGKCERCKVLPMAAVHHLTYARKYEEQLDDLQAICNQCHEFTHGKDWFDPVDYYRLLHWLLSVKDRGNKPIPADLLSGLIGRDDLNDFCRDTVKAIFICWAADCVFACNTLMKSLPFEIPDIYLFNPLGTPAESTFKCYELTGHDPRFCPTEWLASPDED